MDEAFPGATKHRNRGYARHVQQSPYQHLCDATKVVSRLWGYRDEAVGAGGRLARSSAQPQGVCAGCICCMVG